MNHYPTIFKKILSVFLFIALSPTFASENEQVTFSIDANQDGSNETLVSSRYDEYLYINKENEKSLKATNFVIDGYSHFDSVIKSKNGFSIITRANNFDASISIAIEYTNDDYYVSWVDSKSSYMEQDAIEVNTHCVREINKKYLDIDVENLPPFLLNYGDDYFDDFCSLALSSPFAITWFEKQVKEQNIAINERVINLLLNTYPISRGNVAYYNNIGYYLEKMGRYKLAHLVLTKVILHSPDRAVAYLNLGDVYQGLGETAKMKASYLKYFNKMGAMGKEHKVPSRVTSILNSK